MADTKKSDEQVLSADEFNGAVVTYKTLTNTTEYTQTGTSWDRKISWDFTPTDSSSVLRELIIKCNLKTGAAVDPAWIAISINGDNLGYISWEVGQGAGSEMDFLQINTIGTPSGSNGVVLSGSGTSYQTKRQVLNLPFISGDTVYHVDVYMRCEGADTAYIDETTLTMVYDDRIYDDT